MKIYFSDYFNVNSEVLDEYGAFNISLINDVPLFIDPFLLFSSDKQSYQEIHKNMIDYLSFLREISQGREIDKGLLKSWYMFPEVKQNWLGYSLVGNGGSGLGLKFARSLHESLNTIFTSFGNESITKSSHLEKLCLIRAGIGKDSISDFTTNLMKDFLCSYTEKFAKKHIDSKLLKRKKVAHCIFDYKLRRWKHKEFLLPYIDGDYVLLTPKDILTKDDSWISKNDIVGDFDEIIETVPNEQLRSNMNEYLLRQLPLAEATNKEIKDGVIRTLRKFPELIDYYILYKEVNADKAKNISDQKVSQAEQRFIREVKSFSELLNKNTAFYEKGTNTFEEAYSRVMYLKQVIENNDGYRMFYVSGEPIHRESDLQIMFRLTWYASKDDVNSEVNNGRGPVDYKISRGSNDATLVEFKLAKNTKLKQNLENQVAIYEDANNTKQSIKVIIYFNDKEFTRVRKILKDLGLKESKRLVLIDASDNKASASNAKSK
ncbi:hypothetical protein [Kangiella taiwanensis]|uniref:Uncharacterized protein n=1 Tax=Kangiella taiwanensis TaxID=1079179 RepID=A0ABP8I661_9GAMM|nr:hypothetical protein [Kangiella taiwanensis]